MLHVTWALRNEHPLRSGHYSEGDAIATMVGVAIGLHKAERWMRYGDLFACMVLYIGALGYGARHGSECYKPPEYFGEFANDDDVKYAIVITSHGCYAKVVAKLCAISHIDHKCVFLQFFAIYGYVKIPGFVEP
jgi:hypothetical protein